MPDQWTYWNVSTTTNLTVDPTWTRWIDTTSTTTTANTVTYDNGSWRSWVDATAFGDANRVYLAAEPAYTDAELRQREVDLRRRLRENERRRKATEREAAIAQRKARRLLLSHLTPEQRDEFERLERFTVIAADGRTYRVHRKWSHNLELIEGGFITEQLCVHPREQTPVEDSLLAQKLMLETDPDTLRRIANITRLQRRVEAAA